MDHLYRGSAGTGFKLYSRICRFYPHLHGVGLPILALPEGRVLVRAQRPIDLTRAGLVLDVSRPIAASKSLASRLVVIRLTAGTFTAETFLGRFLAESQRQLDALGGGIIVPGPSSSVRVHGRLILGFAVALRGLDEVTSIAVQERGIGGKRSMGCGVFLPC